MALAIVLRIVAVIWSKGYMASDDHFETINVAYNWFLRGMFTDDGNLIWRHHTDGVITRFPLYTFALHGIMRVYHWFGVESLDTMMYGIRAVHAALSLILVYASYRIIELVTRNWRWAFGGGLIMAAHGLMPFLSVRQLIEMVSGECLILALLWVYRYLEERDQSRLFWAGVITAIGMLVRLQVAAAAIPVPFVLWWAERKTGPVVKFLFGGAAVMLLAGISDWLIVGEFLGTVLGTLGAGHEKLYDTIPLMYPLVLLAFFIPPFSILATIACFSRDVWRRHHVLILCTIVFIAAHMLIANRQERFMIPIVGPVCVLFVLALWHQFRRGGWLTRHRWLWPGSVGLSAAVSVLLLVVFTANYGHKGLVEPFARVQGMNPRPRVIMVSPDKHQIYPLHYAGMPMVDQYWVRSWEELRRFEPRPGKPELYLLYPKRAEDLERYRDSVEAQVGPVVLAFRVGPSRVDWLLHALNPKHNPTHECFAYRPATGAGAEAKAVDPAMDSPAGR
ncbi:hypothetical protein GF377_04185 [candidate division GN15 bacterium]|nr:hypothetical protein [candidate division GN15 bacterium]